MHLWSTRAGDAKYTICTISHDEFFFLPLQVPSSEKMTVFMQTKIKKNFQIHRESIAFIYIFLIFYFFKF